MLLMTKLIKRIASAAAAITVVTSVIASPVASALVNNPAPAAKVSFTFDDGLESARTQAASTLAQYGYTGTSYVITNCVGMNRVPNTCAADSQTKYMTWAQIKEMQTRFGWEIGSHTVSHPLLASTDPQDQPVALTQDQVRAELVNSKSALAAQGISATSFAPPYGDYNPSTLAEIAKNYSSMRGFADTGYNAWPYSDYLIRVQQVQAGVTVAQVKSYVDQAIANNQWLVLVFHDIKVTPSTNPDLYQYKTADLKSIAAYIKSKNVPVVNMSKGLVTSDTNLLSNSSFNSGISGGWTTDNAAAITADNATNGSYPDPTNSAKLFAGATNSHLFSPNVAVDSNTTYMLKNYLNLQKLTSGGVGFYIDEYDSFGNWVSGQFKANEPSVFVENMNFTYKPSTANVKQARLQVILPANSGITAYLDNSQWFALSTTTPVAQTNLLANGTFDAGISAGWTTDTTAAFVANAASHGSPTNPVNSIAITASTTKNAHLFSPKVAVTAKTYSLAAYVNLATRSTSELGFYIDEYDANGNWISGQYKGGVSAIAAGDFAMSYTPSSTAVKSASIQVILVSNSGITGYIDDIRWY